jgi:hypothetical protein
MKLLKFCFKNLFKFDNDNKFRLFHGRFSYWHRNSDKFFPIVELTKKSTIVKEYQPLK